MMDEVHGKVRTRFPVLFKIGIFFGLYYLQITLLYPIIVISFLKGIVPTDPKLAYMLYMWTAMAIALLMTYLTNIWISRPLDKIIKALENLSEGEYGITVPEGSGDEIEDLGKSVLRLRESLHIAEEMGLNTEIKDINLKTGDSRFEAMICKLAMGYFLLAVFATYMVMMISYYNIVLEPQSIILFTVVMVAYFIVVTLYIKDRIVKPIEIIARTTGDISMGKFEDIRKLKEIKSGDEIEVIANLIYILGRRIERAYRILEGGEG